MSNLEKLRKAMKIENINYYIIPSSDSHQSEYVSEYFKGREYVSGFTGSAGTLLVGLEDAYLWTDGRYFIQADKELKGSGISLMKMRTPGYPTIEEWIKDNVKENEVLGFDGKVFSVNQYEGYLNIAKDNNFNINMKNDLLDSIWNERPQLPNNKIFLHDEKYAGKSASEKLAQVRKNMKTKNADYFILSSLDDIAWLCNIRGNDIKFNPVALSYVLVGMDYSNIYVDENKVDSETKTKLNSEGFEIKGYNEIEDDVKLLKGTVILDPNKLNAKIFTSLSNEVKAIEV